MLLEYLKLFSFIYRFEQKIRTTDVAINNRRRVYDTWRILLIISTIRFNGLGRLNVPFVELILIPSADDTKILFSLKRRKKWHTVNLLATIIKQSDTDSGKKCVAQQTKTH